MKKLVAIFTLALLITQFIGCNFLGLNLDPKPLTEFQKLPQATQIGANKFGCLINGKAMVSSFGSGCSYRIGRFVLVGRVLLPYMEIPVPSQSIQLVVNDSLVGKAMDVGDVLLNQYPAAYSITYLNDTGCHYAGANTLSGNLKITTFDRKRHIISGTFQFTTSAVGCDTLRVTDGRFDFTVVPF